MGGLHGRGHYRLDNLVFLIDYNKVQAKGFVNQDMSIEPLADKLAPSISSPRGRETATTSPSSSTCSPAAPARSGRPIAVILNTVKGKKVAVCQFNPNWHTSAPRSAAPPALARELWEQDGRRLGIPAEFPAALGEAIEIVRPLHGNPDQIVERQA